ncbi:MAG: hypothetical protein WCS20_00905 [Alphaproteobacteria bacterium]
MDCAIRTARLRRSRGISLGKDADDPGAGFDCAVAAQDGVGGVQFDALGGGGKVRMGRLIVPGLPASYAAVACALAFGARLQRAPY